MSKIFLKKFNPLFKAYGKFPVPYMVPVYHCVSDQDLPHLKNIINYKTTKDFENDLDYMSENFDFTDWSFFKDHYNRPGKKPLALLTVDDGLIQFKDEMMPILLRKGIYAINYINPAFVDNSDMMFRSKISLLAEKIKDEKYSIPKQLLELLEANTVSKAELISKILSLTYKNNPVITEAGKLMDVDFGDYIKKNKIYLDENDLNTVQQKGFGIASHSWDHPNFTGLSLEEQYSNIQKSFSYIKKNGFSDESFAFPFTDFGIKEKLFNQIFNDNTNLKLTFGTAGIKHDSFQSNLQRIPMENGISAEKEINFETNYFYLKKIFNKNKIVRR